MPSRLTNARIHAWLAPDLSALADELDGSRALANSAALWWFARTLTKRDRAEALAEFVKHQAVTRPVCPASTSSGGR